MENTVKTLKEYFSEGTRKVEAKEMMDFWKSLSDEDKEYYKKVDLTKV